jgi:UDP-galactopyranose mutase
MVYYDFLIVGAGISGIVLAERLASIGKQVLIIDQKEHIGGNCFDYYDSAGVLIHKYGPHYFRTNSQKVIDYLSKFTLWIPHKYKVKVRINNSLYPFPINRKTFEIFFNKEFSSEKEFKEFINSLKDLSIVDPSNAEEQVLKNFGKEIFKSFFKGYTEKQWGIDPKKLDVSVTARIPVRYDYNENYFNEEFQAMPKEGYTEMFKKMLLSKNITLKLNTKYEKKYFDLAKKIIWTGRIDSFFDFKYGKLPYRSLKFIFVNFFNKELIQEEGQINYPSKEVPYTRIVEIKHVTHQKINNTTLCLEVPSSKGNPYYPIPNKKNYELYDLYLKESLKLKNIYFIGRLANYKYLNMDQCVENSLSLFQKILEEI